MVEIITKEVESAGAKVEINLQNMCKAVSIPGDSDTVLVSKKALETVGVKAETAFMTGFTDASIYNNHNIEMAVVGIGAQLEHSCDEFIKIEDMEKALKMVVEILRLSAI